MIVRRSDQKRFFALLFALAQACAVVALPMADAILDGAAAAETTHVEPVDSECARHHDELFCTTVRSLQAQSTSTTARGLAVADGGVLFESSHLVELILPAGPRIVGAAGPRAPPLA